VTTAAAPAPALAPVERALAVVRRRRGPDSTAGLVPGLVVPDPSGWTPASAVVSGERLDDLLEAARRRWDATPHAAAAMAFRFYTYWLAMPPVLSWVTAQRVLRLDPDDVLLRFADREPFLVFGWRRARLVVAPGDPLAGTARVTVAATGEHLVGLLRSALREDHFDPLLERIRVRVRLGARTLLGSLASAVAYAAVRGLDRPPEEVTGATRSLLSALGLADLVDLRAGPDGQPAVWRHTCCLAFTLPQPKICSGCCLRR
jgi:hypothetical protein